MFGSKARTCTPGVGGSVAARHLEFRVQSTNLLPHGGRRNAQGLRGRREVAEKSNLAEAAKLPELDLLVSRWQLQC
jgi:hypothetical protein